MPSLSSSTNYIVIVSPCLIQGVGTVVSGTLLQGQIKLNDTLLLGPDALGQFQPVPIRSIHRKRMPVREVRGGQTASFSLKKVGFFLLQEVVPVFTVVVDTAASYAVDIHNS